MLFSRSLVFFSALASVSARVSFFGGDDQIRLQLNEDPTPVPGSNPLLFCDKPEDYLLDIKNVDLLPNPPLA